MSFGSGSGRNSSSSFGGKGGAQRKERKKKQEFHRHKIKYVEEQQLDFDQLKSRTVISLEKLGQQVFSSEPGGYTMHNWIKNFNLLLDDFETKAGPHNLTKEYFEKRLELNASLAKPVDTSEINREIDQLRNDIETISNDIVQADLLGKQQRDAQIGELGSKIDSLKKQYHENERQIEAEKAALEERKRGAKKRSDADSSTSLFKMLFSSKVSDPNSVESVTRRINELQSKRLKLEGEIHTLQEERNSKIRSSQGSDGRKHQQDAERLESLRIRMSDLGIQRAQILQQSEQRKSATAAMSELISKITR